MVLLICLRLVVSYCPVVPRYDIKHLSFMENEHLTFDFTEALIYKQFKLLDVE